MLRMTSLTRFLTCASAFFALAAMPLHAAPSRGSSPARGGAPATPATPAEEADTPAESPEGDDGVVETVRLGGEDNMPTEGVGDAASYEDLTTPDSPTNVSVDTPIPTVDGDDAPFRIPDEDTADPSVHDPSREAFDMTRPNARTMSLTVPGPRGLITDRNGVIMATSEVAYQPAIDFGQQQDESDEAILKIGRSVIAAYEAAGLKVYEKTDAQLLEHYRYRRWLPLPVGPVVRAKEISKIKEKLDAIPNGYLLPLYIRVYPNGQSACHILGYTGSQAKLPTGPINHNDPIFERQEGRSGLEYYFNRQLTGKPGIWRLMFDESGKNILDELQVKPRPGGTVVTTLNMEWQRAAEEVLEKRTHGRGAFVLIDIHTGEVLVLASVPNFDPNDFIPSISQEKYDTLRNDPATPLVSRAFAGVYPPASTFKTITVAAAIRYGVIKEDTYIDCPYSIRIGGHEFRNHNHFTGNINCVTALMQSNNPFMYQVAATMRNCLGAQRLCDSARRFGFGQRTGLPLADKAGNVPDEAWMFRNYGRGFMQGDAANMSIGQGPILATPLQVAHAIAGIADGNYLPRLHLVRQVLDADGNVVYQFTPSPQASLKDFSDALGTVRKGMRAGVHRGTGHRAALSYTSNAGKTGTAQWGKPSDDCRLAWFAGFIPADEPRYAYAALYEGKPHEPLSGGKAAAAIVTGFFEKVKPSMQESLAEKPRPTQIGLDDEVAEEPTPEEEAAITAAEEERARQEAAEREAEKRRSTSGWSDGRSRH